MKFTNLNPSSEAAIATLVDRRINEAMPQTKIHQRQDSIVEVAYIPFDNSMPQQSEGFQFFEVAIVPRSKDAWLLIRAEVILTDSTGGAAGLITGAIFLNDNEDAIASGYLNEREPIGNIVAGTLSFSVSIPATNTEEKIFRFKAGAAFPNVRVRMNSFGGDGDRLGGSNVSSLSVQEFYP